MIGIEGLSPLPTLSPFREGLDVEGSGVYISIGTPTRLGWWVFPMSEPKNRMWTWETGKVIEKVIHRPVFGFRTPYNRTIPRL
jgi:hypothetical protein